MSYFIQDQVIPDQWRQILWSNCHQPQIGPPATGGHKPLQILCARSHTSSKAIFFFHLGYICRSIITTYTILTGHNLTPERTRKADSKFTQHPLGIWSGSVLLKSVFALHLHVHGVHSKFLRYNHERGQCYVFQSVFHYFLTFPLFLFVCN